MSFPGHKLIGDLCSRCDRTDVEFYKGQRQCKNCESLYAQTMYFKKKNVDPAAFSKEQRRRNLNRYYKLTLDDVDFLFEVQSGLCPICQKPLDLDQPKKLAAIEHDHSIVDKRAAVRGLTCAQCNFLLGSACDDPVILRRAIKYLEVAAARKLLGQGAADCVIERFSFMRFVTDFSVGTPVDPLAEEPEETMIAAIEQLEGVHVILWTGRVGLKAKARSYCGRDFDASAGVVQIPESVLLDGKKWQSISDPRLQLEICKACVTRIK